MADREPQGPNDRPNGNMTDTRGVPNAEHPSHDLHLIAAAADREADDATRVAAQRQIAACDDCAALFADLRAISFGLGTLPRSLPVTRDFRISPEQAAKLRPAGWRRLLDGFSRTPSLRPFASALTTLGVAGLLLAVALPNAGIALFGGQAGGAAPLSADLRTSGAPEAAASQGAQAPGADSGGKFTGGPVPASSPAAVVGGPLPTDARNSTGGGSAAGGSSAGPAASGEDTQLVPQAAPEPASPSLPLLPLASIVLLVIGIALLLLSRLGGRDPAP